MENNHHIIRNITILPSSLTLESPLVTSIVRHQILHSTWPRDFRTATHHLQLIIIIVIVIVIVIIIIVLFLLRKVQKNERKLQMSTSKTEKNHKNWNSGKRKSTKHDGWLKASQLKALSLYPGRLLFREPSDPRRVSSSSECRVWHSELLKDRRMSTCCQTVPCASASWLSTHLLQTQTTDQHRATKH